MPKLVNIHAVKSWQTFSCAFRSLSEAAATAVSGRKIWNSAAGTSPLGAFAALGHVPPPPTVVLPSFREHSTVCCIHGGACCSKKKLLAWGRGNHLPFWSWNRKQRRDFRQVLLHMRKSFSVVPSCSGLRCGKGGDWGRVGDAVEEYGTLVEEVPEGTLCEDMEYF